ncbi:MAG: DNA polymerase III subunit beta [Synergistaceae bacterium]|nr:DNA polymerase III subunit beta [Synergistaceae bacterium]
MKLELRRQDFLKAWQITERFVAPRSTKDTVAGILVTASESGQVTLEATDLKTSVRCDAIGVNVIEPGFAVVPADLLGSMLKKYVADELILDVNSERGLLNAGKSKTKFAIIAAEEFPKIPESSAAENICEILGADLARMINDGGCAASQPQDFPKYIGTCLFRTRDGYLKVISTDGKRLALSQMLCEQINKDDDLLLPAQAIKELGKTLSTSYADKSVKILADGSTAWFNLEGVEFSIRLIEATFPNYERILNNVKVTEMKIKSSDLIPVLERIDIIARTTPAHIMAMYLSPNGEVKITARAPEKGTTSEVINAEISGENLQVGFNVGYFLDGLKILSGDSNIEFSGDEGQARMKRNNSDDFLYMLMPARLSAQDRIAEDEMNKEESSEDVPESENENYEQQAAPENPEGENNQQ